MKFKEPKYQDQFNQLPKKLQEIALFFCSLSEQLGIDPVVTRVFDPVVADSGVHEAHRGIDFRDEFENPRGEKDHLYDEDDVNYITSTINNYYPRTDGHLVCIHHSFNGMPYHFHLQIPENWATAAPLS